MSLLSGFNVDLPEVELLGEAAIAAFAGGAIPAGWNVITPQQLGVAPQYWDGNYFTNNGGAPSCCSRAALGSYRFAVLTGRMIFFNIPNSFLARISIASNLCSMPWRRMPLLARVFTLPEQA